MKKLKAPWAWFLAAVAADLVVIFFCLTPKPPQIELEGLPLDKIFHFTVYLGLTFWFIQILRTEFHLKMAALFFCQGMVIEFIQGLSGLRSMELLDMLANTLGVATAFVLFHKNDGLFLRWTNGQ